MRLLLQFLGQNLEGFGLQLVFLRLQIIFNLVCIQKRTPAQSQRGVLGVDNSTNLLGLLLMLHLGRGYWQGHIPKLCLFPLLLIFVVPQHKLLNQVLGALS